jgi:SAM-dependent methyltransferase
MPAAMVLPGSHPGGSPEGNCDTLNEDAAQPKMRWQTRLFVNKLKSALPGEEFLRRAKRHIFGYTPNCARDRGAIEEGLKQVQWVASAIDLQGARVVEIGSGWQPIIPLLYALAGTGEVIMTDLKRLCHPETLAATLDSLALHRKLITEQLRIPEPAFERFHVDVAKEPLDQSLRRFSIRYLAPCDFRNTAFASGSVDAVVSRVVLEHVPPEIIRGIFREARRILRPGGVMCHFIDNSDHWEHGDQRIPRIHFLKYSDSAFRWIQSNGLYQNRLRHSQYGDLLRSAGFRIEREERIVDGGSVRILESFPVAAQFRSFTKEDLATLDSFYLASRPA